jgi:prephenate dehydrogenase
VSGFDNTDLSESPLETVGIVGVGLIGASFGLALREAGFTGRILGVSSAPSIDAGVARGAIDRGATLEEAAGESDLLFLAQPIFGIIETLRQLDPMVRPDALVTDAGSTKRAIAEEAARSLKRCAFVGGHPMAGKEVRGAAAAEAGLFRGRPWVLTKDIDHEFRRWIAVIGAREIILDPVQHDRLVAWSSHLPQLSSTALASLLREKAPEAASVAGPGLLDSTRLAMSSYDLWRDILETNGEEISVALDAYIEKLQALRKDLETEFARGSEFARFLREGR